MTERQKTSRALTERLGIDPGEAPDDEAVAVPESHQRLRDGTAKQELRLALAQDSQQQFVNPEITTRRVNRLMVLGAVCLTGVTLGAAAFGGNRLKDYVSNEIDSLNIPGLTHKH
jgi:hypothetical protein